MGKKKPHHTVIVVLLTFSILGVDLQGSLAVVNRLVVGSYFNEALRQIQIARQFNRVSFLEDTISRGKLLVWLF